MRRIKVPQWGTSANIYSDMQRERINAYDSFKDTDANLEKIEFNKAFWPQVVSSSLMAITVDFGHATLKKQINSETYKKKLRGQLLRLCATIVCWIDAIDCDLGEDKNDVDN